VRVLNRPPDLRGSYFSLLKSLEFVLMLTPASPLAAACISMCLASKFETWRMLGGIFAEALPQRYAGGDP
jgi:hypothetical protein